MYSNRLRFAVILFIVSMMSDVVLDYASTLHGANKALKALIPYYTKYGSILAPILAGVTVLTVYIINVVIFDIYVGIFPHSSIKPFVFLSLAVILGILADFTIDTFHIFGDSLKQWYRLPFSYGWGFVAYLFALLISYIIDKIIVAVYTRNKVILV